MSSNQEYEDYDVDSQVSSGLGRTGGNKTAALVVKKRKLNRACDVCRKRKVRCDFVELPSGNLDKCLNCFSSKVACTFSEDPTPRDSTKSYLQVLEAKVKRSEDLLKLLCPDEKVRQDLLDGRLDSLESPPPQPQCPRMASILAGGIKTDPGYDGVSCRMVHRDFDPGDTPNDSEQFFLGESSNTELIIKALRLKEETRAEWSGEGLRSDVVKMTNGKALEPLESKPREHESQKELRNPVFMVGSARDWTPYRRVEFWKAPTWEDSLYKPSKNNQRPHNFNFPPPRLMRSLVSLYFRYSNLDLPLLHRPTLERGLRNNLHMTDCAFAYTVLLVCAIGARWSDDPAVLLTEADLNKTVAAHLRSPGAALLDEEVLQADIRRLKARWRKTIHYSGGWRYFEQAWEAKSSDNGLLTPTLYDIQFYALSVLYLRRTSFPQASWAVLGVGLRLFQDIGGHRQTKYSSQSMDPCQEELLKRAGWVLVVLDRAISCSTGRPCALQDENIDLSLPIECDDEYWDGAGHRGAFQQPEGKPSLLAAFNASISLYKILATLLRTIYATKSVIRHMNHDRALWDQMVVSSMDSSLNTWYNDLPPHLRWNPKQPNDVFFAQSAALHALYYSLQMLTHRPFIPTPRRPSTISFPSLSICTSAARSIIRIGLALLERAQEVTIEFVLPAFSGGVFLLLKLWDGRVSGRMSKEQIDKEMQDVNSCLTILRASEKQCFSAGKVWDLLYGLATSEIPFSPSTIKPRPTQSAGTNLPMFPLHIVEQRVSKQGSPRSNGRSSVEYDLSIKSASGNPQPSSSATPQVQSHPATPCLIPPRNGNQQLQPAPTMSATNTLAGPSSSPLTSVFPLSAPDVFQPPHYSSGPPEDWNSLPRALSNATPEYTQWHSTEDSSFSSYSHPDTASFLSRSSGFSALEGLGGLGGQMSSSLSEYASPSLMGTDVLCFPNIWDWGVPFQEDYPAGYLFSDLILPWGDHREPGME